MHNQDFNEFSDLLDSAYDLIGVGANKTISSGAKAMFFKAMGGYTIEQFRFALTAHCMDKQRGRFTPKPADIIEQLDGLGGGDHRPGADEAWAIALTSRDEAETVIWTEEMAEAFALCSPVLQMGDEVGARMAFKDAYSRLVSSARHAGKPAKWSASLGWDSAKREAVIQKAQTAGLLPAPVVHALLPNHSAAEFDDCPEGLKRVKEELAKLQDGWAKAAEQRAAAQAAERYATEQKKADIAAQVEQYENVVQLKVQACEERMQVMTRRMEVLANQLSALTGRICV